MLWHRFGIIECGNRARIAGNFSPLPPLSRRPFLQQQGGQGRQFCRQGLRRWRCNGRDSDVTSAPPLPPPPSEGSGGCPRVARGAPPGAQHGCHHPPPPTGHQRATSGPVARWAHPTGRASGRCRHDEPDHPADGAGGVRAIRFGDRIDRKGPTAWHRRRQRLERTRSSRSHRR